MKRIFFLFLTFFCLNVKEVYAEADWTVGRLTCSYEKGSDKISIIYYNVGAAVGDAEVHYQIDYYKGNEHLCYFSGAISNCSSESTFWVNTWGIYNFNSNFKLNEKDFYSIRNRLIRYSYRDETNFKPEELCSKSVFIEDISSMDTVVLCETNSNSAEISECDYKSDDLYKLKAKTIGTGSYAGDTDIDYSGSYNEAKNKEKENCAEVNGVVVNPEKCEEAKADLEATIEAAEETGTSREDLEKTYIKYSNAGYGDDWSAKDCEGILGKIEDKNAPAYYLNFAFNLIKYIAIVLLIVLSVVEFAKATAAKDNDVLKKALNVSIKRLILAVVIFFLPYLINFILELMGWITDPTCGIGV